MSEQQTFKVGDKVAHRTFGRGVIRFGPANFPSFRGGYLMEDTAGDHHVTGREGMTLATAFTVGDVVTLRTSGSRATVEYGPYGVNGDIYIVKLVEPPADSDNPREFSALANVMTKVDDKPAIVPVGTRVRIDRAKWAEGQHGKIGVVQSNTEDWRAGRGDTHPYEVRLDDGSTFHVAELTPVDETSTDIFGQTAFVYEGETYEYGATYQDREGDGFEFDSEMSTDGTNTPRGRLVDRDGGNPGNWLWSLAEVDDKYGPLKKI